MITCTAVCVDGIQDFSAVWVTTVSHIPEPGTVALFGLGLLGLGLARRRKAAG